MLIAELHLPRLPTVHFVIFLSRWHWLSCVYLSEAQLGALAIVTDPSWHQIVAMSLSLSAVALAAIAQILKTKFERSYKRYYLCHTKQNHQPKHNR